MSSFKDLRIVDNFYQTSLFFPMPTVLRVEFYSNCYS